MNQIIIFFTVLLLAYTPVNAQQVKIISKEPLQLTPNVVHRIDSLDPALIKELKSVNLYRIVYLSDGLKVIGFMAEPKAEGLYPCIIANRGGRSDFSLWKPYQVAYYLGRMASWGYVVVASQYRGSSDGSEGKDEYGGSDINDVLNLVPLLTQTAKADTSRMGLYGESRGGMMTFLALKKTCAFKAAAVVAPLSDAFDVIQKRPDLENRTFRISIPDYEKNKDTALRMRSAIYWPDQMCTKTPLLLIHGSADSNVDAQQSIRLTEALHKYKHPVRFILYEGADHFITQFEPEMLSQCRRHFDFYVRDRNAPPKL